MNSVTSAIRGVLARPVSVATLIVLFGCSSGYAQVVRPGVDPLFDAPRGATSFPPTVVVPHISGSPVIDGVIDPAEWSGAAQFDIALGGDPVWLYLAYDGQQLLLAIDDTGDLTVDPFDQVFMYFDDEGGSFPSLGDGAWPVGACPSLEGALVWGDFLDVLDDVLFEGFVDGPTGCGAESALVFSSTAYGHGAGHAQYEATVVLDSGNLVVDDMDSFGVFIGTFDGTSVFSGATGAPSERQNPASYSQLILDAAPAAADSMAGYWPFNEGVGVTTLDHSRRSADGAITDASWAFDDSSFERGTALSFDGLGDMVHIDHSVAGFAFADFTIAAWVQVPSGLAGGLFLKGNGDASWDPGEKQLWFGDGSPCCAPDGEVPSFVGWGNDFLISNTAIDTTSWHHLAVTWDYASGAVGIGRIFIDGQQQAFSLRSYAASVADNLTDTVFVGLDGSFEAQHDFNGLVDDLAVFQGALNLTQVKTIMAGAFHEFSEQPSTLYWTAVDEGTVRSAPIDGGVSQIIHSGLNFPAGIAVDTMDGKLYWTEWFGASNLRRSNLDGTDIEDLIVETGANDVALDHFRGKVYWTNFQQANIKRANLDGSQVEILITGGAPEGIDLDVAAGHIFWADSASGIRRANLDGSGEVLLVAVAPSASLRQVSVDPNLGKVYWAEWSAGAVRRASLDGSDVEDVRLGGSPWGVTTSLVDDRLIISDLGANIVSISNLNAAAPLVNLGGGLSTAYLAVDKSRSHLAAIFSDGFDGASTVNWSSSVP